MPLPRRLADPSPLIPLINSAPACAAATPVSDDPSIRIAGTPLLIDRVNVTNCTSVAGSGGGIESLTFNRFEIRGSRLAGNSALFNGGGISILRSTEVRIADTVIEDNTCAGSPGASALVPPAAHTPYIPVVAI